MTIRRGGTRTRRSPEHWTLSTGDVRRSADTPTTTAERGVATSRAEPSQAEQRDERFTKPRGKDEFEVLRHRRLTFKSIGRVGESRAMMSAFPGYLRSEWCRVRGEMEGTRIRVDGSFCAGRKRNDLCNHRKAQCHACCLCPSASEPTAGFARTSSALPK